jgi:hypothetical protein
MRTKCWFEILKEGDLLEVLDEDWSVVIKCISKKEDTTVQAGQLGGFCEHGDEHAVSIQAAKFVDSLNGCQLLIRAVFHVQWVPDYPGAD